MNLTVRNQIVNLLLGVVSVNNINQSETAESSVREGKFEESEMFRKSENLVSKEHFNFSSTRTLSKVEAGKLHNE